MNKKILSIIVLVFAFGIVNAQKVEGYELQLPKVVLKDVHKVAVVSYESNEKSFGVAENSAKGIVTSLNSKKKGMFVNTHNYNPWLKSQLNEFVKGEATAKNEASALSSASDANAVMVTDIAVEEVYKAVPSQVASKSLEGIPYKQNKFELKRVLNVKGTAKIIKVADKSLMQNWTVAFSKKSEVVAMDYENSPTLKSTGVLAAESSVHLTKLFTDMMQAKLVVHKYNFKKLRKIKDKGQKDLDKEISKMLRKSPKQDLNVIHAKMKKFAEVGLPEGEDNAKVFYNLGLINELVGNYDLAKSYYEKSKGLDVGEKDYTKAIDHLNHLMTIKKLYQNHGFVIKDYVF